MNNVFRKYGLPILFFAALLIFIMCWSLPVGASAFAVDTDLPEVRTEELNRYAAEINGRIVYDEAYADLGITRVSVESYVVLKDFDAHEPTYLAVVFRPCGYAIFNRAADQLIERSPDGACPFDVLSDKDYYYAGYTFYFYREAGKFYDLYSDTEIGDDLVSEFELQSVETKRIAKEKYEAEQRAKLLRGPSNRPNRSVYIPNKSYFMNLSLTHTNRSYTTTEYGKNDALFGFNYNNSCAQVATGMLLQYYDRLGIRDLVGDNIETSTLMNKAYKYDENYYDEKYRDRYNRDSKFRTVAESLHQILRFCTFPEASDGQFGTRNDQMAEGLRTYFTLAQYTGVTVETAPNLGMKKLIRGAIDGGHPAVMTTLVNTGVYNHINGGGTDNVMIGAHTIVAYGYTYDIFNNTDEYITHFGWYDSYSKNANYSLVYLNSNFPATNAGAFRLRF